MTQAHPGSSETRQSIAEPPQHATPAADTEVLLHLRKMSTTAGLDSGDYVAVNVAAVVAVIFGLASVLAALGYVLLIIPLVGIILALVALAQIRDSNGTQTGKGLALAGLILSGGISIAVVGYRGIEAMQRRADQQQIAALCQKFGQLVAQQQFDQAYELFSPQFQKRVALNPFKIHLAALQRGEVVPPMDAIAWNGRAQFQTDPEGSATALAMIRIHYKGSDEEDRQPAQFRRGDGGWKIDDLPQMFPEARETSRQPG